MCLFVCARAHCVRILTRKTVHAPLFNGSHSFVLIAFAGQRIGYRYRNTNTLGCVCTHGALLAIRTGSPILNYYIVGSLHCYADADLVIYIIKIKTEYEK